MRKTSGLFEEIYLAERNICILTTFSFVSLLFGYMILTVFLQSVYVKIHYVYVCCLAHTAEQQGTSFASFRTRWRGVKHKFILLLVIAYTYIPLTLYPQRDSKGISDIPPRRPGFTKTIQL
jgi:hypothetical protein